MPTFYTSLPDNLRDWALAQPVFFTASAPTFGAHINVSPKGHTSSSLAILSANKCAYLDGTGSGCETAAHLRENGRITLMWCSFGASPRIMRWFGTGRVIERGTTSAQGTPEFEAALASMRAARPDGTLDPLPVAASKKAGTDPTRGWRAVIEIDFFKVQTSCGFGVPVMTGLLDPASKSGSARETKPDDTASAPQNARDAVAEDVPDSLAAIRASIAKQAAEDAAAIEAGTKDVYGGPPYNPRATMANFMATMGKEDGNRAKEYQAEWNVRSLDGLPGYYSARRTRLLSGAVRARGKSAVLFVTQAAKNRVRNVWGMREGVAIGLLCGVLLGLLLGLGVDGFVRFCKDWADKAVETVASSL